MDAIIVGIDVAKDRLDVVVRPSGESFVVARTGAGIAELTTRLAALSPRVIALEATGGFETVVAAGLAAAHLPIVVVNPAQVRAFAQALGKRAKTDPIDAAVIAHFAEATRVQPRPLPDDATRLLADLVARRRQIVEMMAAEGQRERRLTDKRLRKSIARLRKAMEKELAELDGDIDDQVRGSPVWAEKEDLLASVPGIGPIIARTLNCLNLVRSIAARSQLWLAWRRGPASPANGAVKASLAADERASATFCSLLPWWRAVTIQPSSSFATSLSPPANQSSSPSLPSPESSSQSSTLSCETNANGYQKPLDHKDNRSSSLRSTSPRARGEVNTRHRSRDAFSARVMLTTPRHKGLDPVVHADCGSVKPIDKSD